MLEFALRYAALGWFIFPLHLIVAGRCECGNPKCGSPGKHPRIKWKAGATCDLEVVRGYWTKWPNAGIGLACGPSGLLVADLDGPKGVEAFQGLLAGGICPPTARARTARGVHVFFRGEGKTRSDPDTKLDTRGVGGFVVLAPSPHVSGHVYRWEVAPWGLADNWDAAIAEAPAALIEYAQGGKGGKKRGTLGEVGGISAAPWSTQTEAPTGNGASNSFTTRLGSCLVDWHEVDRALACIPPGTIGHDDWRDIGMALHSAGDSIERWDAWSSRGGEKYLGREHVEGRWRSFTHRPDGIGLGSLFAIAQEYGYGRDIGENTGRPLVAATAFKEINGHNVLDDSVKEQSKANGHATPLTRPEWIDWTKGDDPRPKPTCRNVRIAIRALGIRGEYDEFRYRMNLGGQMIGQWAGELSDNAVQALRSLIQAQFDFDPSLQAARDAMEQECLDNPFHPIKNYFSSLQWDGRKRLDTWLGRYLGAQDTPFNRAVSRLSLLAAVRRILQPGCKFDQIVVLEAKEGKGKSTALQILAGVENFSDQDILTSPKQVQQELMAGKWIYEIGELAGLHSADTTRVKAFASRQVDRGRRSYGRYAVDQLRTCIFFATTNDAEYLLSQTGNRRFWPVKCGNVDLMALKADRNQIWAEAVLAEKGASLVLPESLWGVAGEIQDSRMIEDPWLDLLEGIEGTVERTAEGEFQWRIATHTLLTAFIKIDPERQTVWHAKRLVGCMRRIGWEHSPKTMRIGSAPQRGFFRHATAEEYAKKGGTVT